MAGRTEFVAGLFVGAALGAVLGLLLAPEPGSEVRRRLAERGRQVGEKALESVKEKAASLRETAEDWAEAARGRWHEVTDEGQG
ncbi:MAG: YtxH domain-containing protein [Clostridiales bacterium]|nr:YtxH domain-containing protein [Clostridiales bacterium]